jgi:hypothetical protein
VCVCVRARTCVCMCVCVGCELVPRRARIRAVSKGACTSSLRPHTGNLRPHMWICGRAEYSYASSLRPHTLVA